MVRWDVAMPRSKQYLGKQKYNRNSPKLTPNPCRHFSKSILLGATGYKYTNKTDPFAIPG